MFSINRHSFIVALTFLLTLLLTTQVHAQPPPSQRTTTSSTTSRRTTNTPSTTRAITSSTSAQTTTPAATTTGRTVAPLTGPADVILNVPNLSVGKISLDVDNLRADINLNAAVAGLVSINAGVQLSVQKINLTISDVKAELDLVVRLGNLVEIVNRVFESLDLNPLLLSLINNVTDIVGDVIGVVDGLLGSITQDGTTLNFLVDNLGHIVQQVTNTAGSTVSTIVGDYTTNMTFTGVQETLSGGLIKKTFSYAPLSALVDIVFNTLGQVVQATVQKKGGSGSGSGTTTKPVVTATATAVRL